MDTQELIIFLQHQGFSNEVTDDFLEHFGKLGMKWGVRAQQHQISKANRLATRRDKLDAKSAKLSARVDKLDAKSEKVHPVVATAKVLGTVAGIAAIATGAVYAKKLLGKRGKTSVSEIKTFANTVAPAHAKGPGWEIKGSKESVDNFVKSMMENAYRQQTTM